MAQPAAARFLGQPIKRKEDKRLITGHGRYVADVVRPGMLHAAFLRSDVARARITKLDVSKARAHPGVVEVFTGSQFGLVEREAWHTMLGNSGMVPFRELADDDVRAVGDLIALVVADSRYTAEDACELIELDLEPLDPVVDYITANAPGAPIVHHEKGTNAMAAVPFMPLAADVDETFANAPHVVECWIEQHRYNPVPMEGHGIIATWDPHNEELDCIISTQSVHESKIFFARYLGIPEGQVRISMRDVGGGFGQKMFNGREECCVVLAAQALGATVSWIEDRRENLIAGGSSRNEYAKAKIAFDDNYIIQAIAVTEHNADVGAYPVCPAALSPNLVGGLYKVNRYGFSMGLTFTNTMGKVAYRGPWMMETTVREVLVEYAAHELGIDPIELRRRNMIRKEDLPFTHLPGIPGMESVFTEITPYECMEKLVEMVDYDAFRAEQAKARAEGRYLGIGFSVYIEPCAMPFPGGGTEAANIRVDRSGKVTVYMSTNNHGQSIETTMAQVVAEELGVDYDDVTIIQGDSDKTPYGPGTGGSRTAILAGSAAREASLKLRDKILAIAAHTLEAAPDDLQIDQSVVSVRGTPTKSMTFREIGEIAYKVDLMRTMPEGLEPGLESQVRFTPTAAPTWSNAAHACIVEIDPVTCIPELKRYLVAEDCGNMINPMIVDGQIFGGVVQGLSGVLLENSPYDEAGNPLATTFMDYLLATTTEIPDIEVSHIVTPTSTNPGGYKGVGEGGAIGSHAAVANAVMDALWHTGARATKSPMGPGEIFEMLAAVGR